MYRGVYIFIYEYIKEIRLYYMREDTCFLRFVYLKNEIWLYNYFLGLIVYKGERDKV